MIPKTKNVKNVNIANNDAIHKNNGVRGKTKMMKYQIMIK
jgi:hypothetical protein